MMTAPVPLLVLLGVGAVLTGLLAYAFWRDPVKGMADATHRPEKLPLVMVDRYIAVTIFQIGLFFSDRWK